MFESMTVSMASYIQYYGSATTKSKSSQSKKNKNASKEISITSPSK